jgi:hypothetical protein
MTTIHCPTCDGTGRVHLETIDARINKEGATGRDHPATSRQAGTTPRKGSQRLHVLETLIDFGPQTAHEIAGRLSKSPNQIATRLGELHDDQFVMFHRDDLGDITTRITTPGNTGRVHAVMPLGETTVERHRAPRWTEGMF